MNAMIRLAYPGVAAGVLSLLAIHLAYWMNMMAGVDLDPSGHCNPYVEGCVSTSGAVRKGPGIVPFKAIMLMVSPLMVYSWILTRRWLMLQVPGGAVNAGVIRTLGIIGALALVIYVIWLGTDGDIYGWLRRYGTTVFLGCSALALLLLARTMWQSLGGARQVSFVRAFLGVVALQWLIGVISVAKGFLLNNEELISRLENIFEWWFLVALSLAFILKGLIMQRWPDTIET